MLRGVSRYHLDATWNSERHWNQTLIYIYCALGRKKHCACFAMLINELLRSSKARCTNVLPTYGDIANRVDTSNQALQTQRHDMGCCISCSMLGSTARGLRRLLFPRTLTCDEIRMTRYGSLWAMNTDNNNATFVFP